MDEFLMKTGGPETPKILWRPRPGRQLGLSPEPYRQFHSVVRTVHMDDAIKICAENRMKPRHITSFCSLNGRKLAPGHPCHGLQVLWFGTRSNGDDEDGHNWYGNVEFAFLPEVFLNHFKFCFLVEILTAPTHTATRLLITNTDYSTVFDHYDPYRKGGPWYVDPAGRHFSLKDCARFRDEGFNRHPHELEFMVEMRPFGQREILTEAEISFRNHEDAKDFSLKRICHRFQRYSGKHHTCPWALSAADASQVFFLLHQSESQRRHSIASPRLSQTAAYFRQCYMMAQQSQASPWLVLSQGPHLEQTLRLNASNNLLAERLWSTTAKPVLLQVGEQFQFVNYDALVSSLRLVVKNKSWKLFSWDAFGQIYQKWILTHEVYVSHNISQELPDYYQNTNQFHFNQHQTERQPHSGYYQNANLEYANAHVDTHQEYPSLCENINQEDPRLHQQYPRLDHIGKQENHSLQPIATHSNPGFQENQGQQHPMPSQSIKQQDSSHNQSNNQHYPSLQQIDNQSYPSLPLSVDQPHAGLNHKESHSDSQRQNDLQTQYSLQYNAKLSNNSPQLNSVNPDKHEIVSGQTNSVQKKGGKGKTKHSLYTDGKSSSQLQHQQQENNHIKDKKQVNHRQHDNQPHESHLSASFAEIARSKPAVSFPSKPKPLQYVTCNVMLSRSYAQTLTIAIHSVPRERPPTGRCFQRQKFQRVVFTSAPLRKGSSKLFLHVANLHPETEVKEFEETLLQAFPQVKYVRARKYPKERLGSCNFTAVVFGDDDLFEEDFVDSKVFPPPIEVNVHQWRPNEA